MKESFGGVLPLGNAPMSKQDAVVPGLRVHLHQQGSARGLGGVLILTGLNQSPPPRTYIRGVPSTKEFTMINRIYWTGDIRIDNPFLKKRLFPLELVPEDAITVIVAKNGSGKTRLLSSIEQLCKIEGRLKNQNLPKFERRSLLQDKERLHISIETENDEEMPVYMMKQDSILHSATFMGDPLELASKFMSNGEGRKKLVDRIKALAEHLREKGKKCVLILDELDSGLDFKEQMKLAGVLKKCTDVFQVFMVTHNVVTMMQFDKVFDIEKKCFRSTADYLNDAMPKSTMKKLREM